MDQESVSLHQQPWGRAIGLLISCLTIVIGIIRVVGPAEIVVRAVIAGGLTAVVVRGLIWLVMLATPETREE